MQSEVVSLVVPPPPDPFLTVNLYCDARLDELIGRVVAPFWRELKALGGGSWHLWMLRYARRGEHLKIRLHGPDEQRATVQGLLEQRARRYFSSLEAPEEGAPRRISRKSPPIDADDQAEGDHPDRALLWTRYRRSHVSLAGEPFLLDDRCVSLLVRCLANGCERVLDALCQDGFEVVAPGSARPGILLKLVADGLAGPDLSTRQRAQYLPYHRDWLIRFSLLGRQADPDRLTEVVAQFDRRLESMAGQMAALRKVLERDWGGGEFVETALNRSLAELLRYSRTLCESVDYHIDPFASDPAFVCLFKALHAVSNQLGVAILDEAFVYHMLTRAAGPAPEPHASDSGR
jgi:hypothetical protein